MTYSLHGNVPFPKFSGVKCYMMPIIQGVGESLPDELSHYKETVECLTLQHGEVGYLTIDESFVEAGTSQRGYGKGERTVHTEACLSGPIISWGQPKPTWGKTTTLLDPSTRAVIVNSIDDTCMVWNEDVLDTTKDGDLSHRVGEWPRSVGYLMKANQAVNIGIWTPHECIPQKRSGNRQFLRLVGKGVSGRDPSFTVNSKLAA